MPGFDQTGPTGNGPQSGGRRGPCAAENTAQNRQRGFGRRMRNNNENQPGTGEDWRPNKGNGQGSAFGSGNGPGFGGGQRRRFRRGQD